MALLKHGRITEDLWSHLADQEAIALDQLPIVTLARWQAERESLIGRNRPLGIRLESDQAISLIATDLRYFDLVALAFPTFADGRAYSNARLLRERYGYRGELRAVGNVLRDQMPFMLRCGFDAFEVANEAAAASWSEAINEISVCYQPAADGRRPVANANFDDSEDTERHSAPPALRDEPAPLACAGAWAY